MQSHELAGLLSRIQLACRERPAPPFVSAPDDDFDRARAVQVLGCLWSEDQIPEIHSDADVIQSALIALRKDEFRFAFLRLLAAGVGNSNQGSIGAVVECAAEPVAKGSHNPPGKFAAFSVSEIQLTSEVICLFVGDVAMEEMFESTRRVYLRSRRNWKLFSEATQ